MCKCFEPAYNDFDFGYGIGVLGHLMWDVEHIGFQLFKGATSVHGSYSDHIHTLVNQISNEIGRASETPLKEIPEFNITWGPSDEFQQGYLSGLRAMRNSLTELSEKIQNTSSISHDDTFEELITPWADDWHDKNQKYNFLNVEPIASDDLRGISVRLISDTRATLVVDEDPTTGPSWLELEMLEVDPVREFIIELWSKLAYSGTGITFQRGQESTGPVSLDEEVYSFELANLCDKHWGQVVDVNNELLKSVGLV